MGFPRASRAKPDARAGKKEGGWRVDIHQEFLPALAFRRHRISYFVLRNAPPRILFDYFHFIW
ncbi:MAG: hypothetical protein COT32_01430 [Candidatus Nealsonbacteria bacterium CG08_land_8_20_14_0_20_36_22]|uniref:Uncharacterized protein n=1 Tax=Candidatus Nealsonbacteria bacterium CG08_land_8_20_14_0_20_36_22 TaxID=1974704 RepID=A0A2H0YQW1_9BACT|nr:MAG: hypothetical protein COT32_01430 [Candidatus Nealsonbacteria bacterium CG08_land_8_20_14_0_20_36_22]